MRTVLVLVLVLFQSAVGADPVTVTVDVDKTKADAKELAQRAVKIAEREQLLLAAEMLLKESLIETIKGKDRLEELAGLNTDKLPGRIFLTAAEIPLLGLIYTLSSGAIDLATPDISYWKEYVSIKRKLKSYDDVVKEGNYSLSRDQIDHKYSLQKRLQTIQNEGIPMRPSIFSEAGFALRGISRAALITVIGFSAVAVTGDNIYLTFSSRAERDQFLANLTNRLNELKTVVLND